MRAQSLIEIAGFRIAVESSDPDLAFAVPASCRAFLADTGTPDVVVSARWADLAEPRSGELVFDAGVLWKLYQTADALEFCFTSPAFGVVPYKVARFRDRFSRGEVLLHRTYFAGRACPYPLDYPIDELLMIHLLAQTGGLEVHACGVVDSDGAGYVFCGQSGAGKSTTAGLWRAEPDVLILSDDRIILREREGRVWMFGTPWHGDAALASPAGAPLVAAHFLEHGPADHVRRLAPAAAAAQLFACAFVPFYSPEALASSLAMIDRLVTLVPCAALTFVPSPNVIEQVRLAGRQASPAAHTSSSI